MNTYLESIKKLFAYYKQLGEGAMTQLSAEDFTKEIIEGTNSVSVMVGHLSGNMLSRWTNFLSEDGEKEWRKRDQEFEEKLKSKGEILRSWEKGWQCLFNAINSLKEEDLSKIIYIRNEGHTVIEAIHRQLGHYAYHIGQLVFVAKQFKGDDWQSLSIPKGNSQKFNADKFKQDKSRKHFV